MRIQCPFCGERDISEFTYLGDASYRRPESTPAGSTGSTSPDVAGRFHEAVYLRDNPAGPHEELWYHTAGCRGWLRVRRNTLTHEILNVDFARPDAAGRERTHER
jgi:methylglutamate dehydrogenase subunit B